LKEDLHFTSVHLSACFISESTQRISTKFDTGDFQYSLSVEVYCVSCLCSPYYLCHIWKEISQKGSSYKK